MMLEICLFIQARTAAMAIPYVMGTNLFPNQYIQDSQDRCTVVINSAGGEIDRFISGFSHPSLQFIARDEDWKNARDDVNIIRDLFWQMAHVNLPQYESDTPLYLIYSHPQGEATFLGEDEKNRKQYAISIEFNIRNQ